MAGYKGIPYRPPSRLETPQVLSPSRLSLDQGPSVDTSLSPPPYSLKAAYEGAEPLLPTHTISNYAPARADANTRGLYIRPFVRIAYIIACALACIAAGISWSILSAYVGRAALARHEPYQGTTIESLLIASGLGGAILGATCGLVLWGIHTAADINAQWRWSSDDGDALPENGNNDDESDAKFYISFFGILFSVLSTGFFGQALGVVLLHTRLQGLLDVRNALECNAVGQPLMILAIVAAFGSPYYAFWYT